MTEPTTTKCPHCAEEIRAEAKVCKHCGRDVASLGGGRALTLTEIVLVSTIGIIVIAIGALALKHYVIDEPRREGERDACLFLYGTEEC